MPIAYLGVGSNVGDRLASIQLAARELGKLPSTRVLRTSELIETEPVGMVDKGRFLNGVFEVETTLAPSDLLAGMLAIEAAAGRLPPGQRIKWGPRTLDLDILFYDDLVMKTEGLTIPHPFMHTRWFVLKPLAELIPHKQHPVLNVDIATLLGKLEQ